MPDEDRNFGGSLVLDFWKWWRHVKTIYWYGGFVISALVPGLSILGSSGSSGCSHRVVFDTLTEPLSTLVYK